MVLGSVVQNRSGRSSVIHEHGSAIRTLGLINNLRDCDPYVLPERAFSYNISAKTPADGDAGQ